MHFLSLTTGQTTKCQRSQTNERFKKKKRTAISSEYVFFFLFVTSAVFVCVYVFRSGIKRREEIVAYPCTSPDGPSVRRKKKGQQEKRHNKREWIKRERERERKKMGKKKTGGDCTLFTINGDRKDGRSRVEYGENRWGNRRRNPKNHDVKERKRREVGHLSTELRQSFPWNKTKPLPAASLVLRCLRTPKRVD